MISGTEVMKGRHNGCIMNVYSEILGCGPLAGIPVLPKKAGQRLKWFGYYRPPNQNARRTCRYFSVSPQSFYRWKRHYYPAQTESLGDRPIATGI